MPTYSRSEARAWARETLFGCTNTLLPSFTRDFSALNEAGIRHDVRRNKELGFGGALCIPEAGTSLAEYLQLVRTSVDEAGDDFIIHHYASFDSLEHSIEATNLADAAGAQATLLGYPPSFYPRDREEIYRWTKRFCDATDLGVVLFAAPTLWGFDRLHGAGLDPETMARLVADCPNIIAIKAEGGAPSIAGFVQTRQLVGDAVMVTTPLEWQSIPMKQLGVELQWQSPAHIDAYGDAIPRLWQLSDAGETEKLWELYWRIQPFRSIHAGLSIGPHRLINWWAWKYLGWLNGMNGGALRQPTQRLDGGQMASARRAMERSGIQVTPDGDELFFAGRHAAGE